MNEHLRTSRRHALSMKLLTILQAIILITAAESDRNDDSGNYDEVSKSDDLRLDLDEFLKTYPVGSGEVVTNDGHISHLESHFDHNGGGEGGVPHTGSGFIPSKPSGGFIPSHDLAYDPDLERLKAERLLEQNNQLHNGGGSNGPPRSPNIPPSFSPGYRPEHMELKKGPYRNSYEGQGSYPGKPGNNFAAPAGPPSHGHGRPNHTPGYNGANYKNVVAPSGPVVPPHENAFRPNFPTGFSSSSGNNGFNGHAGNVGFSHGTSGPSKGPTSGPGFPRGLDDGFNGGDIDDFRVGNSVDGHMPSGFGGLGSNNLPPTHLKPIIHKHVYVHAAPPDDDPPPKPPVIYHSTPPKRNYQIVFIKAPVPQPAPMPVIPPPPQNSDKTLIYVLHSKPEDAPPIKIPPLAPLKPNKPEVFFIRYKGNKGSREEVNFPHLPPGFPLPPSYYRRRFGRNDNNIRNAAAAAINDKYSEERHSEEISDHPWSGEESGQSSDQKPLSEPSEASEVSESDLSREEEDTTSASQYNDPGSEADSTSEHQDSERKWEPVSETRWPGRGRNVDASEVDESKSSWDSSGGTNSPEVPSLIQSSSLNRSDSHQSRHSPMEQKVDFVSPTVHEKTSVSPISYETDTTSSFGHKGPSTSSFGHERPSTNSFDHERGSTSSFGHDRPSTSSFGHEKSSTSSFSYDRPSSSSFGHEKPSKSSFANERPLTSSFGHEKFSTNSFGQDGPSSSSFSHEKSSASSFRHDRPSTSSFGHEKSSTSSFGHDRPLSSAFGHEKPSTSSYVGHERPSMDVNGGRAITTKSARNADQSFQFVDDDDFNLSAFLDSNPSASSKIKNHSDISPNFNTSFNYEDSISDEDAKDLLERMHSEDILKKISIPNNLSSRDSYYEVNSHRKSDDSRTLDNYLNYPQVSLKDINTPRGKNAH